MDEPNYVYVIRFSDRVHKIGISRDPNKRLSQLSCQHRHPLSLVRTWLREGGDAGRVESLAHTVLAEFRSFDFSGEEIFAVTAEAACCAVELAHALHRNSVESVLPELPVPVSTLLAEIASLPILKGHLGYIEPSGEGEKVDQILAMRRAGVDPGRIYANFLSAKKALREGDTLFMESDAPVDYEWMSQRGVEVRHV